jgi:hypothetical protein
LGRRRRAAAVGLLVVVVEVMGTGILAGNWAGDFVMVGRLKRRNMAGTTTPCRAAKRTTWFVLESS